MTLIEFLVWCLSDFWRFIGLLLLVTAVASGLGAAVAAIRGR